MHVSIRLEERSLESDLLKVSAWFWKLRMGQELEHCSQRRAHEKTMLSADDSSLVARRSFRKRRHLHLREGLAGFDWDVDQHVPSFHTKGEVVTANPKVRRHLRRLDPLLRLLAPSRQRASPDPSGSCPEDPGVHNWIDTCGMNEGMLTLRMAEFPGGKPATDVSARGRVVALDALDAELPEGTIRLDAAGREKQRRERAAGYLRRLPEGEG